MTRFEWLPSMSFCSERTFLQSPACVARTIRCLRLRTIRWAARQSTASQSVGLLGPFAGPGARIQLILGLPTLATFFGWLTRSTSATFRYGSGDRIHRVISSPCLSAGGIGFLDHPVPAAGLGRPCGRLTGMPPDCNGVTTFRNGEKRRGRVPPLLRGLGVRTGGKSASLSVGLVLPWRTIVPATGLYGASSEVHRHSPVPSFPEPVSPDGSDCPWLLPLASHVPVTREARRDWESAGTLAEVLQPLTHCDLVSHDFRGHLAVRRSPLPFRGA
jgi:hypothetical protein